MNTFVVENKTVIGWLIDNPSDIVGGNGIYSPKFSIPSCTVSSAFENVQWQLQLQRGKYVGKYVGSLVISLRNSTGTEASMTFEVTVYSSDRIIVKGKTEGKVGKKGGLDLDAEGEDFYPYKICDPEFGDVKVICFISNMLSQKKSAATYRVEREDDAVREDVCELTAHYESLLETGKYSDVTFNIGEKSMQLHKNILTSTSEVFRAMFDHEMKEQKENVVNIVDVDFNVMKEVLRYIYARKVNGIEAIAAELFVVADRYAVEGLKQLCENKLIDQLNVDNALSHFELSMKSGMVNLKAKVLDFVVQNMKELVGKEEFKKLSPDCNYELLSYISTKTIYDPCP